jgi:TPR repeat protein
MIRLFELTDNPQYANTLGYIYYYGRCNNGVPEYDQAFYYFSYAAANGLYEGMYKLADLFWHGYGCKKAPKLPAESMSWFIPTATKSF